MGYVEGLKAKNHMDSWPSCAATACRPRRTSSASTRSTAAVAHCEELIERLHELDFEIDGLVLKVNASTSASGWAARRKARAG